MKMIALVTFTGKSSMGEGMSVIATGLDVATNVNILLSFPFKHSMYMRIVALSTFQKTWTVVISYDVSSLSCYGKNVRIVKNQKIIDSFSPYLI